MDRNADRRSVAARTAVFAKILRHTTGVGDVLELGANIGQNLLAIRNLLPDCRLAAVEINRKAAERLATIEDTRVHTGSITDFAPADLGSFDLTFTSGVLIHISPDRLPQVYNLLHGCSRKYILVWEYYNPTPVTVPYRGHSERLYKRDFAGELLERNTDLELVDYGFQYRRDHNFPADDSTWFLLAKKARGAA